MASGEILGPISSTLQCKVVWGSSSNGSAANSSTVSATVYARKTTDVATYGRSWSGYVAIGGTHFTINFNSSVSVSSNWVQMATGTVVINHNADGTKIVTIEGSVTGPSGTTLANATSYISQDVTLDQIPRYITGYNFITESSTMNSFTIKWQTNENISAIKYGINPSQLIEEKASGRTGTFTIGNLEPRSNYDVYVNFKRADSGLYLPNNILTGSATNDSGKLMSDATVNIGDTVSIKWLNPTGASLSLALYTLNGTLVQNFGNLPSTSGGPFTQTVLPNASLIYPLTPTSNQITLKFVLTSTENGKSYTAESQTVFNVINSNPIFSNFTYQDNNSKTLALTGNNQTIIKGHSSVLATITPTNKAIARNSAIMQIYRLIVGTKTSSARYDASSTVNIQVHNVDAGVINVYAIDSRGNSTASSKTPLNYINYSDIILKTANAERVGGVGTSVTLTYSGAIWNNNFGNEKNEIQSFKYYYKKTNSSSWIEGKSTLNYSLSGNTFSGSTSIQGDLAGSGFTQTESFNIRVEVSDKLSSSTFEFILGSGKPVVAYHKKGVAINKKFNIDDTSVLQVDGKIGANDLSINNMITCNSLVAINNISSSNNIIATEKVSGKKIEASEYLSTPKIEDTKNISYAGTETDSNISFEDIGTYGYLHRSGLYTIKNGGVWYNLINIRHRNGESDGTSFGMQIARKLQTSNAPLQVRAEWSNSSWTPWADIQNCISLYDNSSGTQGTIYLSYSASVFSYIEIFYGKLGIQSTKVHSPNYKSVQLTYSYLATSSIIQTGTEVIYINGTTITRGKNNFYNIESNTVSGPISESSISIKKVIGYY